MKTTILTLLSAIFLNPVWGQIAQSHPEYCGIPGNVNPPLSNVSATVDLSNGHATLFIGQGTAAKVVELPPNLISEISEICPLSDGRMVVFGDFGGGIAIDVVDTIHASVLDSFLAYRPALSPNQRWIAYDKFYPLHGVEASDEIMLYDLTKSPVQNRPDSDARETRDVGTLIFPPGHQNCPGSNVVRKGHRIGIGSLCRNPLLGTRQPRDLVCGSGREGSRDHPRHPRRQRHGVRVPPCPDPS